MDAERFMDGLEIAQVLPGPNIVNLAIYCGQRVRGVPGAIAAFLGASLPPFAIVLVVGALSFGMRPIRGCTERCAAAPPGALGLTIGNALELTWDERTDWVKLALVAMTAVTVSVLKMPLLLVLVVFGGFGIAREYVRSRAASRRA